MAAVRVDRRRTLVALLLSQYGNASAAIALPDNVPVAASGPTVFSCPYLSRWPAARVSGWYGLVLRNTDPGTSRPVRLQGSREAGNACALP